MLHSFKASKHAWHWPSFAPETLSHSKNELRSLFTTRNWPKTWYARAIPFSFSLCSRVEPIPGSLETSFCPIGLLTKLSCFFEESPIIPWENKNSRMMLNDFRRQIYQYFHCSNLFMIFVQLLARSVVNNDRKFVKAKRKTSWLVSSPTKFQWNITWGVTECVTGVLTAFLRLLLSITEQKTAKWIV